jgi:hypothetical protein
MYSVLAFLTLLTFIRSEDFLKDAGKEAEKVKNDIEDILNLKCFWIKDFNLFQLWELRTKPDVA